MLPPARAALIEAGHPIRVSIPQPATTASVLFDVRFAPAPPAPLAVFDLSPSARALLAECRNWGEAGPPLTRYETTLFAALAAVVWRLAEQPSLLVVPAGRSPQLRQALELTRQRLGTDLRFADIADQVGFSGRSLARRFEDETGMTWRAVLRRMRVARAVEELAAGDASVTDIASKSATRRFRPSTPRFGI